YFFDSVQRMFLNADLCHILFQNNENEKAKHLSKIIIDFANRTSCQILKDYVFTIERNYFIDNGLYSELTILYESKYPEELHVLSVKDTSLYFRLKAYIFESKGEMDSSLAYYQKAENNLLEKNNSNAFLANFYKRYGQ